MQIVYLWNRTKFTYDRTVRWVKHRFFPQSYDYRLLREEETEMCDGRDIHASSRYTVLESWSNRCAHFGRVLLSGDADLDLPYMKQNWGEGNGDRITYAYELQRRPHGAYRALWKSLGYLPWTRYLEHDET